MDNRNKTKIISIIVVVLIICAGAALAFVADHQKKIREQEQKAQEEQEKRDNYEKAVGLFKSGKYSGALVLFKKGNIGKSNSQYLKAAELLTENLTDESINEDIGEAYSYYAGLSDDDEDEKCIKEAFMNNKYIQLYDSILGTYKNRYDDKIIVYENGKVEYDISALILDWHLYNEKGEVYFAGDGYNDLSDRWYIHDWEKTLDTLHEIYFVMKAKDLGNLIDFKRVQ